MIDIKYVSAVRWDEKLGTRLKTLRGKTSRRELALRTQSKGNGVSHQYIQQLEQPQIFAKRLKTSENLTVSFEVVQVLCEALGVDISDLFDSAKITVTP